MSAMRQRRRMSLSMSLPDVSCAEGASLNGSIQEFVPMAPLPSSPLRTVDGNYNIDDDRWADKMDSATGSVFFIDPQSGGSQNLLEGGYIPRSFSSCSSISSMTSDLPHAPSPTVSLRSESLTERLSRSLQLAPDSPLPERHSPSSFDHTPLGPASFDHPPQTPDLTDSLHVPESAVLPTKKTSSLKRIKKALKKRISSGSLSDLNEVRLDSHIQSLPTFSESDSTGPNTPTMPLPEGAQYGSHGLSLQTPRYSPMYGRSHKGATMTRVSLDLTQFNLGASINPCTLERLGIVPSRSLTKGKFGSTFSLKYPKGSHPSALEANQSVLIRGVLPGSPAAVTQQFFSGDTIHYVEGHSVSVDNIDAVLAGLSGKIQFVLKRGYQRQRSRLAQYTIHSSPVPSGLVRLVSGVKDVVRSYSHSSHHHTSLLLYLTLDTEEDDPSGKDILYQWPRRECEDGSPLDNLVHVRGLFLTLADLLGEVTKSKSFCSTIAVEGNMLHLGYTKYGRELLLVALPAKQATPYQVRLLVDKLSSSLELLYGTVHSAFTTSTTHWSLDHLLAVFFDAVINPPKGGVLDSTLPHVAAVPQLKLPPDFRVRLSSALSGLDSGDHSNRPEILHNKRPFSLLGSCLFLKGALVCNHLSDSDLKDVVQLCDAYRLPELTAMESINQIVIWKQVFLSRLRPADSSTTVKHHFPLGGHFVLIVGLEHVFVALLMEAGSSFVPHSPPRVDAVYVDRARSLIMELRAQDLLSEYEEKGLPSTPLPSLNTADIALASKFTRRASISLAPLPPTIPRRRKASEPVIISTPQSHFKSLVGESSDSDDPVSKGSPGAHRRTQSLIGNLREKSRSVSVGHSSQIVSGSGKKGLVPRQPYMLTSGVDSILFHYLHLSPGRGILLCPTHTTPPGPVQSELLHTFRETCLTIRETLCGHVEGVCDVESDSESDDGWSSDEEVKKSEKRKSPFAPSASGVIEHGVLIQCGIHSPEKHKSSPTLNYWVVGRLVEERGTRTELYVCYQENMSQDHVEMAYKLLFGWTG